MASLSASARAILSTLPLASFSQRRELDSALAKEALKRLMVGNDGLDVDPQPLRNPQSSLEILMLVGHVSDSRDNYKRMH